MKTTTVFYIPQLSLFLFTSSSSNIWSFEPNFDERTWEREREREGSARDCYRRERWTQFSSEPITKVFWLFSSATFGENDGEPQVSSLELTDATEQHCRSRERGHAPLSASHRHVAGEERKSHRDAILSTWRDDTRDHAKPVATRHRRQPVKATETHPVPAFRLSSSSSVLQLLDAEGTACAAALLPRSGPCVDAS